MIFTKPSYGERYRILSEWHRVFAWFPVRLDARRVAWLRWVWRRATPASLYDDGGMVFEYKDGPP